LYGECGDDEGGWGDGGDSIIGFLWSESPACPLPHSRFNYYWRLDCTNNN